MDTFIQQIINGLVLGSVYALVALGYTMVYGIINLINFAHGEVLMVGALTSWTVVTGLAGMGIPGWAMLLLSLIAAIVVCAALNFAIEKIAYRPLRNAPRLAPLITAMGMSLLLQTLAMIIWKPNYKPFPILLPAEPFNIGGAVINVTQILILVVTAVTLAGLMFLVNKTKLGRAMRATAENPRVASLMGVRPDMVISATFIIGAALAALAGVMYAANYGSVQHTMGFLPGLKAFTAAVFGGIGNLPGAMVGALTSWTVVTALAPFGLPGWALLLLGLIAAVIVCSALNFAIEKIAYRPLRNAPRLAPLITAMGMSLLLQTLAMIIWKPNYKSFPILLPAEPFNIGGAVINVTQILILVVTAVTLAGLMFLVNKTKLGRAMRATAENPRVASLMGVRPDMVISATFIIGAALAALAGVMYAANYGSVQHTMGFLPGLKAFTAAVFGGIGNLPGAMVGGVLLGLIESLGAGYIGALTGGVLGSHYQDIFAFIVLILVLTLRPQGLLGERVADRA